MEPTTDHGGAPAKRGDDEGRTGDDEATGEGNGEGNGDGDIVTSRGSGDGDIVTWQGGGDGDGDRDGDGVTSPGSATTPISPPYWSHHSHDHNNQQHQRSSSNASVCTLDPAPITLEDHTEQPSELSSALWAKQVSIDDYVLVSGSRTGVGAYVVYQCRVDTLDGGPITIRKRYSEFDELRRKLIQTFPHSKAAMPDLPPKSAFWKTQRRFLESRRVGLAYFLNCILLNPEFSGAPVLKEFLFS